MTTISTDQKPTIGVHGWEGNGFVVSVQNVVVGHTVREDEARAVKRWLDAMGQKARHELALLLEA